MNNQVVIGDAPAIRKMGMEALSEKLGPIGTIEFINQFDSGFGDYTKERHQWLDKLTIDDIASEIYKNKPPRLTGRSVAGGADVN